MRDVEERLKSLTVPEPSENLRKRIFGEEPARDTKIQKNRVGLDEAKPARCEKS